MVANIKTEPDSQHASLLPEFQPGGVNGVQILRYLRCGDDQSWMTGWPKPDGGLISDLKVNEMTVEFFGVQGIGQIGGLNKIGRPGDAQKSSKSEGKEGLSFSSALQGATATQAVGRAGRRRPRRPGAGAQGAGCQRPVRAGSG